MVDHLVHAALTKCHKLGDNTKVVLGDVNRESLNGLVEFAINEAGDDLWFANGQLEAFTFHHFYQNRELKFASALDFPRVGTLSWQNPN